MDTLDFVDSDRRDTRPIPPDTEFGSPSPVPAVSGQCKDDISDLTIDSPEQSPRTRKMLQDREQRRIQDQEYLVSLKLDKEKFCFKKTLIARDRKVSYHPSFFRVFFLVSLQRLYRIVESFVKN